MKTVVNSVGGLVQSVTFEPETKEEKEAAKKAEAEAKARAEAEAKAAEEALKTGQGNAS